MRRRRRKRRRRRRRRTVDTTDYMFTCTILLLQCLFPSHPSPILLQVMVRDVEEKLVMKVVIPQLVHLARDSEM